MSEPFTPDQAVTFDLANGLVHLADAPSRILAPGDALSALLSSAPLEAQSAFARALGAPLGTRVARRLDSATATPDAMIEHLGGELGLAGLGALSIERWGDAMVLCVDHTPLAPGALGEVLGEALRTATGSEVHLVMLMSDKTRARFFVGSQKGRDAAAALLRDGKSWSEVLVQLHDAKSVEKAS